MTKKDLEHIEKAVEVIQKHKAMAERRHRESSEALTAAENWHSRKMIANSLTNQAKTQVSALSSNLEDFLEEQRKKAQKEESK